MHNIYLIVLMLKGPKPGLGYTIKFLVPHNAAVIQGRLVTERWARIAWKAIMESSVQNSLLKVYFDFGKVKNCAQWSVGEPKQDNPNFHFANEAKLGNRDITI